MNTRTQGWQSQRQALVDGLDIEQTAQQLRQDWPSIRHALLARNYRPSPVRKVLIPKPVGRERELGIAAHLLARH